jgi:hypothetical protein
VNSDEERERDEIDTKDFSNLSPREIAQQHIMLAIDALGKQQRQKTARMNKLIELNQHMPAGAQTEWSALLSDLKSLQRDIDLLAVLHRHQT